MEILSTKCSGIFRRLRQRKHIFQIEEIKQLFGNVIAYLNKLSSDKRRTDGMTLLTIICDELASLNIFRLFDHLTLRNHHIFNYIKQTFEMLFIKSIHSQTISMTKQEEDCLNSTSYLIVQLCLFQNEPIELFYGSVPKKTFKIMNKPNMRDSTFDQSSVKSPDLTDKPNLKTASLPSSAPRARPIEHKKWDITQILGIKKFPYIFTAIAEEIKFVHPVLQPQQNSSPSRKFQDVFLSKSFFDMLVRTIDDLSQNEYSPYHITYKVVDRLVRLCSQLSIPDLLLKPIVKCLQSNIYRHALETVEVNQIQLHPKQLFFLHECPQFIIRHNFLQQDHVLHSVCKKFIKTTKLLFDIHFSATDIEINSNKDGDRRLAMHVISCHLEFLYHLSIFPSSKEYFMDSSIILQLIRVLKQKELTESVDKNKYLFNADVGIIAYSLLLLCNLAYEQTILLQLKQTEIKDICTDLKFARDDTIKFASKTLITILNEDNINENHEPTKLRDVYIKYVDSIANKPNQETHTGYSGYVKEIEIETKYKFLTESFIERLLRDIKPMSTEEYPPNMSKYKETVRRIRICSKQESDQVEVLLNPVIDCLKSDYYMKSYEKLDLIQKKIDWRTYQNDRILAAKQTFFMRECPEFLFQHDYKRQKEIATVLCDLMLHKAQTIFNQYLPAVIIAEDLGENNEMRNAQIEALSLHIKLLGHFALTPTVRKNFLTTSIIDHIILILENKILLDENHHVLETHIGIIRESLTLLHNLALTNDIKAVLKTKNLLSICRKFSSEKDTIIQFTSQTLIIMLDPKTVDRVDDPQALCKTYVDLMNKSTKEPRRPYQGVKLRGLIQNLQIIVQNDTFQENIVEEKEGVSSLTKCLFIECEEKSSSTEKTFEKIRRFALDILWNILCSIYRSKACQQLRSNDRFVEYVLKVLTQPAPKPKKIARSIIWKLGDERTFRSEVAEKERKQNDQDGDDGIDVDDRQTTGIQHGDFDLFVSFSHNVADKNICRKISTRLHAHNIHVYIEKEGKHRLTIMRKAAQRRKMILICLSNEFRKSKECMTEIEYVSKYKCPMIPILTDATYKPQGWLNHLIEDKVVIDFTKKNMADALQTLMNEINKLNEIDQ